MIPFGAVQAQPVAITHKFPREVATWQGVKHKNMCVRLKTKDRNIVKITIPGVWPDARDYGDTEGEIVIQDLYDDDERVSNGLINIVGPPGSVDCFGYATP